jgi:prevent-host-death family protein
MTKQYSIAEARGRLPGLVHEVEAGEPVVLTRRGRRVAVLVSAEEYDRLTGRAPRHNFGEALRRFRERMDLEQLWEEGNPWEDVRDRSTDGGRRFDWCSGEMRDS